jgi:superfamily I DNA and/or RNA helicase
MNNKDKDVSFDTVIIDEAARVAPMDLLIAMVLAKRRIILVGDHRQLPHMVNEDVIKRSDLSENEYINKSIFGYLKERAKKLEEYDNIKRAVTLDNQYRTHPILGQFVSDNFYKRYGEAFNSPLGTKIGKVDDYFNQRLKGIENVPAVWIDVSNQECKEQRAWSRKCEAQRIIEYLKKWVFSKEGNELSFGIITFYRNQVEIINNLINKEFTKEERDSFTKRLKVGTVDSFQGMEFDIVFLSAVRSRDLRTINDKLKDYNLFGFLISKNRLCVSMSRQKKSLIVVGDKMFFESDRAKNDVAELYNFLQLCKHKGKIL